MIKFDFFIWLKCVNVDFMILINTTHTVVYTAVFLFGAAISDLSVVILPVKSREFSLDNRLVQKVYR